MQYKTLTHLSNAHEDGIWTVAWAPTLITSNKPAASTNEGGGLTKIEEADISAGVIVTGSVDETVRLWHPEVTPKAMDTYEDAVIVPDHLRPLHSIGGHRLGVISVAVDRLGKFAVTSSLDSRIRFIDIASGSQLGIIEAGPVECWSLAISPTPNDPMDDDWLPNPNTAGKQHKDEQNNSTTEVGGGAGTGAADGATDTTGGAGAGTGTDPLPLPLPTHEDSSTVGGSGGGGGGGGGSSSSSSFRPYPTLIASGTQQGTCNIWEAETRELVSTLDTKTGQALFTDPRLGGNGGNGGLGGNSGSEEGSFSGSGGGGGGGVAGGGAGCFVMSVDFSPRIGIDLHNVLEGRGQLLLACGRMDGSVVVFDVERGVSVQVLVGHALPVRCVKFSPNGSILYTGSDDKRINAYDTGVSTTMPALNLHPPTNQGAGGLQPLAPTANGGGRVSNGGILLAESFTGHSSWVLCVACSPDNRHFVSGSADRTVKVWDFATKELLHTIDDVHQDMVWSVAYSPDGRLVASAGDDGAVHVFSVATAASTSASGSGD